MTAKKKARYYEEEDVWKFDPGHGDSVFELCFTEGSAGTARNDDARFEVWAHILRPNGPPKGPSLGPQLLLPEWQVRATFVQHKGRRALRSLCVEPAMTNGWSKTSTTNVPENGITASVLRQVPLRDMNAAIDAVLDYHRGGQGGETEPISQFGESKRGRPKNDDLKYAQYAKTYFSHSGSRQQIVDTANDFGIEASQMRNLLYRARKRGLLTSAGPGRAGGGPTDKALRILDAEKKRLRKSSSSARTNGPSHDR